MKRRKKLTTFADLYYDPKASSSLGGKDRFLRGVAKHKNMKLCDAEGWLAQQDAYTLHKPLRKKFPTAKVLVRGIDDQWMSDLLELCKYSCKNKGFKYVLVAVDCLSKYAWCVPLKNKTGKAVRDALVNIFRMSGRVPRKIQSDCGKEYWNKHVHELLNQFKITPFSVTSSVKACIAERFVRTLKERIWRHFTYSGSKVWINVLDDLVYAYNHSRHRTIGRCPADVNKNNETEVWRYMYAKDERISRPPKFNDGDAVRIAKTSIVFKKGYAGGWSSEVFSIQSRVPDRIPFMYILKDSDNEIIKGAFYEHELQKIIPQQEVAVYEKVLRTKGSKPNRKFLVKWENKPIAAASWVHEKNFI